MLRTLLRTQRPAQLSPVASKRPFVSTVLLSRTWEDETVVNLRKEAKHRGLSTKGNKATLISRLQAYEVAAVAQDPSPARQPPGTSRRASSQVTPAVDHSPQASSPGIRTAPERPTPSSAEFFAFKMPELVRPAPATSAQVPYLPDFWNSAKPNVSSEPEPPRLHVVGDAATHRNGGPTYNLEKHSEADAVPSAVVWMDRDITVRSARLREVLADAGLATTVRLRPVVNPTLVTEDVPRSRPLTSAETRGLYVLLGIFAGSWIVGGIVNRPPPASAEVHHMEVEH